MYAGKKVHRSPGDRWMLNGPMEYIPPIQIGTIKTRWVAAGGGGWEGGTIKCVLLE